MDENDIPGGPGLVLTAAERKELKARAHHLKPVVMIGDAGLTPAVLAEADRALAVHELVKLRVFGDDRAEREAAMAALCAQLGCARVQMIGKLLVVYRPKPVEATDAGHGPHVPKKAAARGVTAADVKAAARAKRAAAVPTGAARGVPGARPGERSAGPRTATPGGRPGAGGRSTAGRSTPAGRSASGGRTAGAGRTPFGSAAGGMGFGDGPPRARGGGRAAPDEGAGRSGPGAGRSGPGTGRSGPGAGRAGPGGGRSGGFADGGAPRGAGKAPVARKAGGRFASAEAGRPTTHKARPAKAPPGRGSAGARAGAKAGGTRTRAKKR